MTPIVDERGYLKIPDGHIVHLPNPRCGVIAHIFEEDTVLAINMALATGRPLLVRGRPGTGKSQLAVAAAHTLGRAFIRFTVDAETEVRDPMWRVEAIERLAHAQVVGNLGAEINARDEVSIERFIQPGPLWWAFNWREAAKVLGERPRTQCFAAKPQRLTNTADPNSGFCAVHWTPAEGTVVLIDEIDKADVSVPNGLLDALGAGRFDTPLGKPIEMDRSRPPLVVFTTNEERTLPDAFLRRCLVLHLALPRKRPALERYLVVRGRARFPDCSEDVLKEAATQLAGDREGLMAEGLSPPGMAEYIDLVEAVVQQCETSEAQLALLARLKRFVLEKHAPMTRLEDG